MWCVWLNCLLCLLLRPDDDILNRKSLSILQIPPTILFPLLFSTLLKSNHTSVRVSPALYYCLLSHQLLTKTKIDPVVTVIYDLINYTCPYKREIHFKSQLPSSYQFLNINLVLNGQTFGGYIDHKFFNPDLFNLELFEPWIF